MKTRVWKTYYEETPMWYVQEKFLFMWFTVDISASFKSPEDAITKYLRKRPPDEYQEFIIKETGIQFIRRSK